MPCGGGYKDCESKLHREGKLLFEWCESGDVRGTHTAQGGEDSLLYCH